MLSLCTSQAYRSRTQIKARSSSLTRTKAEKALFFNKYNDYSDVCVTCEQYGDLACCQRKGYHNVYCIECEGFGDLGEVPKTG